MPKRADRLVAAFDGTVFRVVEGDTSSLGKGDMVEIKPFDRRTEANHKHYFAAIRTGWSNLPDDLASQFPNAEALRKWCLIQEGHCEHRMQVCDSNAQAERIAALVSGLNGGVVASVEGRVVNIWRPHSQALGAMSDKEFNASKKAVLERIAGMLGISAGQLGDPAWDAL